MNFKTLLSVLLLLIVKFTTAQTYSPIAITGFNQDVIAESGTSSLTTTTMALDGVTVSNKVMYSAAFKTANGFGGGGLADNGTIVNATSTYQLAPYNGNNALVLPRAQNGDLTLTTPAKFTSIRVLALATEGSALINATVYFTDGTTAAGVTNYTVPDWFNGTPNLVVGGFGRCTRATPASGADAYPSNPSLYYVNIPIACADRQKNVQKINIANITTAGSNAPFPNAVFFAASGVSYSQTVTPTVTNGSCSAGGSISLNITGSTSPYTVSWNTSPVQTGTTASNLPAGTYTATITDANSCTSTYTGTVTITNTLTLTAHADTTICAGASFNANTVSNGTTFLWTPAAGVSNTSAQSPILSPASTTPYTVTATLGTGCTATKTFTVTVNPLPILNVHIDTTICIGSSFNANTVSNGTSFTWTPTAGVSNPTAASPVLSPVVTTPYVVTASIGLCSTTKNFTVTVPAALTANAGNDVTITQGNSTILQGSGSAGTYTWTPSTGLSASNVLTPTASPAATTIYRLTVTNSGCTAFDEVTVTVIQNCMQIMNAISPNQDGVNDRWLVTSNGCATNIKAKIYNRYGGLVYESENYQNDWQGTYKGKPVPDGTYYYVVEYISSGKKLYLKGDVTVIR